MRLFSIPFKISEGRSIYLFYFDASDHNFKMNRSMDKGDETRNISLEHISNRQLIQSPSNRNVRKVE